MSRKKKPSGRKPLFERGKNRDNYQRRGNSLSPQKTILVACEGKQTEPNYFNALRSTLRQQKHPCSDYPRRRKSSHSHLPGPKHGS